MLHPKNNNYSFYQQKSTLTLNQLLNKKPQVTTLNDIIIVNNHENKYDFEEVDVPPKIFPQKVINNTKINTKTLNTNTLNSNTLNSKTLNSKTLNSKTLNSNTLNSKTLNNTTIKSDNKIINESSSSDSTYSTKLADSSKSSSSVSDSSSSEEKSEVVLSDTKIYWTCGNRGIKIENFNSIMSKNLSIMFIVDNIFNEYIDSVLSNSYSKLFDKETNTKIELNSGFIESNFGKVSATIKDKFSGKYNILEASFVTLNNIKLTDKDLKNNSIPNLQSLLSHTDNNYHTSKILKLFSFNDKINLIENLSNKNNNFNLFNKNANQYISELVEKGNKKKIFKSNKCTGFYIKIYNNNAKAFFIDEKNNLIYYIASNINFTASSINIRYYTFETKNCKIIKH